jgi:hypothetical protein
MKHWLGAIPSGQFLTQVRVAGMHLARSRMSVSAIAVLALAALVAVATVAFAIRRQSIRVLVLAVASMFLGISLVASPTAALALGKF